MNCLLKNNFVKKNVYHLSVGIQIHYSWHLSALFLKNSVSVFKIYLPSYYYSRFNKNNIELMFLDKKKYSTVIMHLSSFYNKLSSFHFIKMKIRGLGYRVREVFEGYYSFFFNYTNYFYLHLPDKIFLSIRKKNFILISLDWQVLKLVVSQILLLKVIGPYRLRGIRLARQIILLKKSGKTI